MFIFVFIKGFFVIADGQSEVSFLSQLVATKHQSDEGSNQGPISGSLYYLH